MSESVFYIISIIRLFVFNILIAVMIILPAAQTLEILSLSNYELVKFNDDGSTDNQENIEHNSKDEKTVFQIYNVTYSYYVYKKKIRYKKNQELISYFNQDIFIPPPEKI